MTPASTLAMGRPDVVERFLARLRGTHPDFVRIYTQGGCYQLFLTLREIWPSATAWSDLDHVWTEISHRFYDIRGRHLVLPTAARPIDLCVARRAHRWHHRNFFAKRSWREVLELPPTGVISKATIDARYLRLASIHHADKADGSPEAMAELNVARDQALAEIERRQLNSKTAPSPKGRRHDH